MQAGEKMEPLISIRLYFAYPSNELGLPILQALYLK
jgi:hypothetical protein